MCKTVQVRFDAVDFHLIEFREGGHHIRKKLGTHVPAQETQSCQLSQVFQRAYDFQGLWANLTEVKL